MTFGYAKRPWYHETWFCLLLIVFSASAMGLTAISRSKTIFIHEKQIIVKAIKEEKNEKINSNRPRK